MPDWSKVKGDPVKVAEHNERTRLYNKNKYDTNSEYREYMRDKARKRKAMIREQKHSNV